MIDSTKKPCPFQNDDDDNSPKDRHISDTHARGYEEDVQEVDGRENDENDDDDVNENDEDYVVQLPIKPSCWWYNIIEPPRGIKVKLLAHQRLIL